MEKTARTSPGTVIDLTQPRKVRRWGPAAGALVLVLGAVAAITWVMSLKAETAAERDRARAGLRRTAFSLGSFVFTLDLPASARMKAGGPGVEIAVGPESGEVVCRMDLVEKELEGSRLAEKAEAVAATSAPPGHEIAIRRTRRIGPGGRAPAREIVMRPPGTPRAVNGAESRGAEMHLLLVEIPDGLLRITYELKASHPVEMQDQIEVLISSILWDA